MHPTPIKSHHTRDELYKISKKEKNGRTRARILGIAAILEGKKRTEAAKIAGLNENVFRIWIKRYNEQGIDGLKSIKPPGRSKKTTADMRIAVKEKMLAGANYERDGLIRFRLSDIKDFLNKEYNVEYSQSGVWYMLKDLELSWISVRPKHPKTDDKKIEEFKEGFKKKSK